MAERPSYDPVPAPVCVCTHGAGNHQRGPCFIRSCNCTAYVEDTADYERRRAAWKLRNRKE